MRICLICVEIFINKFGGFGRATRTIGRELAKRGIEIYAVVPRQGYQKPVEIHDRITILSFPKRQPWKAMELLRQADADVYHCSEPSMSTVFAMRAMPDRKHMIRFRDPRNIHDWKKQFDRPARSKAQVVSNFTYENNLLVSWAVRRADRVYSLAKYLIPKIRKRYRLDTDPIFLPTPVGVPASVEKAAKPTVGYLARWDRVKRPEVFLQLAEKFPEVHFIAAGSALDERWENHLREKYGRAPNLEMHGRVDQFEEPEKYSAIRGRCWMMVNTSAKEALPTPSSKPRPTGVRFWLASTPTVSPPSSATTYSRETRKRTYPTARTSREGSPGCWRTIVGESTDGGATSTYGPRSRRNARSGSISKPTSS